MTTLADTVAFADGPLSQARGLIGRREFPDGHALVFRFGSVRPRRVHMVGVPFDLDVLWLERERVVATATLSAWTGTKRARGETVIELPAGAADGVRIGDTVRVEGTA